jgi:hypothetical protein
MMYPVIRQEALRGDRTLAVGCSDTAAYRSEVQLLEVPVPGHTEVGTVGHMGNRPLALCRPARALYMSSLQVHIAAVLPHARKGGSQRRKLGR